MDPDATFQLLLDAIADDRHEDIAEHAEDLYTWMTRGGFAPTITTGKRREHFELWLTLMCRKTKGTMENS